MATNVEEAWRSLVNAGISGYDWDEDERAGIRVLTDLLADERQAGRQEAIDSFTDRLDGLLASERRANPKVMAEALQQLWRVRNLDDSFVWNLPVPPDENTAKALSAAYNAILDRKGV